MTAYLDDPIVYSATWKENLAQLRVVMDRLRTVGLTAKPPNCQLGMSRCTYLGHVVGNGLVCPEPPKIQSVESFPTPANKKQVRRFLGLTGYYRKFIPEYAKTAAPLTDLTRENKPNQLL